MPADTIDRLLTSLAVRAHAFALCEIKANNRLTFESVKSATIHYVLAGTGTIRACGGIDTSYRPSSVIIVPARIEHSLGTADASAYTRASTTACGLLANGLVRFTAGEGRLNSLIVCASMTASYGGALGVFDGLTAPLVHHTEGDDALGAVFPALIREVTTPGLGTQALVESLMKQALILLLRHHLMRLNASSPLFKALHDSRLARAVVAVVESPAIAWTVEMLASVAGMSRSAFAEHFVRAFEQTPIEFVQIVRLRLGADLLRATDLPVPLIAATSGYTSRTYFDRAFRAAHGITPCAYRTRSREGEAVAHSSPSPPLSAPETRAPDAAIDPVLAEFVEAHVGRRKD